MTALNQLSQMIPQDQALANKALAVSLQGITGISLLSLPQFASAVGNVQTTAGLPLISAQKQAVPPATAATLLSKTATGSGPNGSLGIVDFLGTAAGYPAASVLTAAGVTFSQFANLQPLINVYGFMANTVNGTFGDPTTGPIIIPGGPAAGTYANAEVAFTGVGGSGIGLIPAAQSEIANQVATNPAQVSSLNSGFTKITNQTTTETLNQTKANLDFTQLTANSTSSIYSMVQSLPQYGQDTTEGGMAQFMQGVADKTTLTGQAIIAAMREGQSSLNSTGISSNAQVPAQPASPPPQAKLLPAQYPYPR